MLQNWLYIFMGFSVVLSYPTWYDTKKFKIGIEYDNSLPMKGGSDRYRHRNNYEPFFVTVTAESKSGYVITYLEVTATVDYAGKIDFNVIRGQTGSKNIVFQLVSNHTDFLSYSYLTYGIKEEEYRKMNNIITLPPATNKGIMLQDIGLKTITLIVITYLFSH